MRLAAPPPARLIGLAGLAAFGAWQWGLLVSPGGAGRVLLALAGAAGAGGLLIAGGRLGPLMRTALTAAAALAAGVLVLLAAGVPTQLLAPANWSELIDGIGQGVQALPTVTVPYADADPWPRQTVDHVVTEIGRERLRVNPRARERLEQRARFFMRDCERTKAPQPRH